MKFSRLKSRYFTLAALVFLWVVGCRTSDAHGGDPLMDAPPAAALAAPEVVLAALPEDEHSHSHGHSHDSSTPTVTENTTTADSAFTDVQAGPVTVRSALNHSLYGRSSTDHLILKVDLNTASKKPRKRQPLNLALVFDRSGSMAEESKFKHAMRAANMVFENLSDSDIVSLIVFNDVATVLSPAGRAVNKDFLRYRLTQFGPSGDTNLSAALLEAFAQIDSKSADGQLKRVIVLTDGLANRGITDPKKLHKLVAAAHTRGIGVSTLGCGLQFSEEVLSDLAKAGGGRYRYIRSGELIPEAVAAELDGLLDVVSQNAKLKVRVTSGAAITRVYGRLIEDPLPAYTFELGDIRDGERGAFLLELTPTAFKDGDIVGVDVTMTLDNPETGTRERYTLSNSATFSKNADLIQKSENKSVQMYANVLDAMEKAEEAIQGMDVERYKEARALFDHSYEASHQYAIDSRDQQLLNQTFLLKHFMAELLTTSDRALIHNHDAARKQFRKEADYRRYLLEHHRQRKAP